MSDPPFQNPAVAAKFATYPPNIRPKVAALRRLIFDTAAKTEGLGDIAETLIAAALRYHRRHQDLVAKKASRGLP